MKDVLIKWTGTKRLQSKHIIKHFPDHINTYYEPFLGSGAMLYKLMTSTKTVGRYICGDNNEHLINVWKIVKESPARLIEQYTKMREKVSYDYYMEVRKRFNEEKDPIDFFFLLRTCRNGLVRFNNKGQFNVCFHYGRLGMPADKMAETIHHWSDLLNKKSVEIEQRDYKEVNSEKGDFLYLDPPYSKPGVGQFYEALFDYEELWGWLERQKGDYAMSMDGLQGEEDISLNVPAKLYTERHLVPGGANRLNHEISERDRIYDSLYIRQGAS